MLFAGKFNFALVLFSILLWSGVAFSESAIQTDWSYGPGVYGPVTNWEETFYSSSEIYWESEVGSLSLMPYEVSIYPAYTACTSIGVADFDGDGDVDVMGTSYARRLILWCENTDGTGTDWVYHNIASNISRPQSAYVADVDADGDSDIIVSLSLNTEPTGIKWWENEDGAGTTWSVHIVENDPAENFHVYAADIDSDGDIDVLGTSYSGDQIVWWKNLDGIGTSWTYGIIDYDFEGAISACGIDVDGDGDIDVVGAGRIADEIAWWENLTGMGTTWVKRSIDNQFEGAHSVHASDMDTDGDIDVLGAGLYCNGISWWENADTGSGIYWIEHPVDTNVDTAYDAVSIDVDNDGDQDVIGMGNGEMSWWDNVDGSGTIWTEHLVDRYSHSDILVADVNDDESMDVISITDSAQVICWWSILDYCANAQLESSIFDTGTDPAWGNLEWSSVTPGGTSVSFQVRASDNYTNLGDWSETLNDPCPLAGTLSDGDRFVQYRTLLTTSNPGNTPTLNEVNISWNEMGVEEESHSETFSLLGVSPNPASGIAVLSFTLPEYAFVELLVYDTSGRLVSMPICGAMFPGNHSVQVEGLSPGIYFCHLVSGELRDEGRFVLL